MKTWRDQAPSGDLKDALEQARNHSLSETEINDRIKLLNGKFELAKIRRRYEDFDSNILSEAEVQELIALEQAQMKRMLDYQNKSEIWASANPSTRGPAPRMESGFIGETDPRLQELQGKIRSADEIKRVKDRVEKLNSTYNITLSDSEIGELTSLEVESRTFEAEFTRVLMEAQKNNPSNDDDYSEANMQNAINALPKDLMQRMLIVEKRKEAIKAPLEAAENAERIRIQMTDLSQESGVPILSGELAETIALNAEKDRIQSKTQYDAFDKWINEGGDLNFAQPLPNDEDYARIKEIDAQLKAISAPMTDAKNAALEADNPALRQQRLEQEKRQKWNDEWQDRKQAGDIPPDAKLNSPSYAEIQDRVTDYGAKLKTRAEKVGYSVSDTEIETLETLNEEMLTIRKKVYDMEADGTAMTRGEYGLKSPVFGLAAGMYKVRRIEKKQREILAGLSDAETSLNGASQSGQSETGSTRYNRQSSEVLDRQFDDAMKAFGAETLIKSFCDRGIEVSQAEADDLLAFERAMEDE